jgi:hypothetical protein
MMECGPGPISGILKPSPTNRPQAALAIQSLVRRAGSPHACGVGIPQAHERVLNQSSSCVQTPSSDGSKTMYCFRRQSRILRDTLVL